MIINKPLTKTLLKTVQFLAAASILSLPIISFADEGDGENASTITTTMTDTSDAAQNTSTYLYNLGTYMGYDLNSSGAGTIASSSSDSQVNNAINTQFLAAVSFVSSMSLLVNPSQNITIIPNLYSSSNSTYYQIPTSVLTDYPSSKYYNSSLSGNYSVWSSFFQEDSPSTVSAISTVDQSVADESSSSSDNSSYLPDLTSQIIFNTLTTPNFTYCTQDGTVSTWIQSPCVPANGNGSTLTNLTDLGVLNNILGGETATTGTSGSTTTYAYGVSLPNLNDAVSTSSTGVNASLVPVLNINTLLAPLMYNTSNSDTGSTGSASASSAYPTGNQITQAAAFIRYVSGQNQMSLLADDSTYNSVYSNMTSGSSTAETQNEAAAALFNYFMGLRTYTANLSVGVSNLAAIMAKRMPNGSTKTSTAFNEYVMATRRVLDPSQTGSSSGNATNQWISAMETAPPVTLQREMLYLLAEINYQLYLSRMQDEKILATLSILQLQSTNMLKEQVKLQNPSSSSSSSS